MKKSSLLKITVCFITILSLIGMSSVYAKIGTGVLHVSDVGYGGAEIYQDSHGFFEVLPGVTYYIWITGITEFPDGTDITVKISCDDSKYPNLEVGTGAGGSLSVNVEPPYLMPDLPYSTTCTVHYKGSRGPDYLTIVPGGVSSVGHLHVIPELPIIGTAGALAAL
ncbi:MAG: hypothetical protein GTO54_13050, partial [Nitrososphaeria archaeon]|nr:hypothetical protein [Nitrososphaeria archaeon]